MIFNVLTLYKELIEAYAATGVIGRGCQSGAIEIKPFDIRDYTLDKHGNVDDSPYGGGAGMVMAPQPVYDCVKAVKNGRNVPVVFFSPKGRVFDSSVAKEYAALDEVILLCGHFEGVDQRAIDLCVDEEISMGDYILTGGHIAAMSFIDSVARYVHGVLGNFASTGEESFENGYLEHEQYTRPYEFMGLTVPDVLLCGDHAKVHAYQKQRSKAITEEKRPDLILRNTLSEDEK